MSCSVRTKEKWLCASLSLMPFGRARLIGDHSEDAVAMTTGCRWCSSFTELSTEKVPSGFLDQRLGHRAVAGIPAAAGVEATGGGAFVEHQGRLLRGLL